MALFIGIASFISGGYTGDTMRWDCIEDSTNVFNDSHSEPGPHGTVYEFTFSNNIRDIPYRIELYDVPAGGGFGNLVKSWVVTPTTSTIQLEDDIEIIVGHGDIYDPNQDDTATPVMPVLIGKKYNVYRRMVGQLLRLREAEFTPDTVNGGFALNFGQQFSQDDVYIVKIVPVLIINPPGTVQGGFYKAVELITADRIVTNDDAGKLFIVEQATGVLTITMPSVSTFTEGIPLFFDVIGSNTAAVNCVVQLLTGESVLCNGFNDTKLIFSRGQGGKIIRKGNQFYGENNHFDAYNRGQMHFCNWVSPNRIFALGQEVNQIDYPGLMQALSKFPSGGVLTTLSSWQFPINSCLYYRLNNGPGGGGEQGSRIIYPNKGKFAIYSVGGVPKIRIPDWRNMFQRAMRYDFPGTDANRVGANIPGGFQQSRFADHDHAIPFQGVGDINGDGNGGGIGYGGSWNRMKLTELSGGGALTYRDGQETAPDNLAQMPGIII